jgi:hypothetical protein
MGKKKAIFIVDGLNLFHSICNTLELKDTAINLEKLCKQIIKEAEYVNTIELFGTNYKGNNSLAIQQRKFFHLNSRLRKVTLHPGIFRKRKLVCHKCKNTIFYYQEKHTDINIGFKLIETNQVFNNSKIYFISADDDFTPLLKKTSLNKNGNQIIRVLPPGRFSTNFYPIIHLNKAQLLKSRF